MTKKHSELIIYSDGGSRGNPGPAAVGVVLFDTSHKVVSEISRTIGEATNNVAEYMGVIYGLMEAVYLGASTVTIKVDSQLIARQLKGEYRIKDKQIKKYADLALNLFRHFGKIEIVEIPREENVAADALVNKALDKENLF